MKTGFGVHGDWAIECRDKFGNLKWKEYVFNLITNQALDNVLDVYFTGGTAYANHYCFLYSDNKTPAAGWLYANGGSAGTDYTEFTNYDEAARPTWVNAGVSSRIITNSASPATFTASTGVNTTIYGCGMVNVSTKGDAASGVGILFCATKFGTARPWLETEEIKVVYTVTASSI